MKTTPEIVPWSEEMAIIEKTFPAKLIGLQESHWKLGIETLAYVLNKLFGKTSITNLVNESHKHNFNLKFSKTLSDYLVEYTYSTKHATVRAIKKILSCIQIPEEFVKRIKIIQDDKKNEDNDAYSTYVTLKYKNLSKDDPARVNIEKWIDLLKKNTRNSDKKSILNNVIFWEKLLLLFNQNFANFDSTAILKILNPVSLTLEYCLNVDLKLPIGAKISKGKFFFSYIIDLNQPKEFWKTNASKTVHFEPTDNTDNHRISVTELECLYAIATENQLDELIFMFFITTGIRIGGLVNIEIKNVAEFIRDDVVVKDRGVTLEKFSKWFTFIISPKLSILIKNWIKFGRKSTSSPYLFPNNLNGHVTTMTIRNLFNKIVKKSNLTGKHLHPHAMRHSFAHILLESGNDVEAVSKIMGHSSSKTTSEFYLRENAAEVAARSNIPWLKKEPVKKIVPDFLLTNTTNSDVKKKEKRRKKVRIFKELNQALSSLSLSASLPAEQSSVSAKSEILPQIDDADETVDA